jgi:hypothetical protein
MDRANRNVCPEFFVTKTILVLIGILVLCVPGTAQRKARPPKFDAKKNAEKLKELAVKSKASRESLLEATANYQNSLEKLLIPLCEREAILSHDISKKQKLVADGLMVQREVTPVDEELKLIISNIKDTNKKILQAEQFVVEIATMETMEASRTNASLQRPNVYFDNRRYIRYTGGAAWSLRDYGKVEGFFQGRTRRALPVSAFGQSETHNRLGFDHSNSFDVALHPDTLEAQLLMSYLRSAGIPFTAFRGAIPGNATGAHIHIGYPSHRFR